MFVFGAKNFSRGKGPKGPFPLELPLLKIIVGQGGGAYTLPLRPPPVPLFYRGRSGAIDLSTVLGSITIWGGCLAYRRTTAWTHGRVVSLS